MKLLKLLRRLLLFDLPFALPDTGYDRRFERAVVSGDRFKRRCGRNALFNMVPVRGPLEPGHLHAGFSFYRETVCRPRKKR